MSDANVMRRLGAAMRTSHKIPCGSSDSLNLVPELDDTVLKFGDGTRSLDVKIFGNTTSDYMLWDASASSFTATGAAVVNVPDGQLQLSSTTVLATAAEINKACDVSTRLVNTTATTLSVTATQHGGRIVTISSAAPIAVSLPAASGSGEVYRFVIGVIATATAHTISCNGTDVFAGVSVIAQTDTAQVNGFLTTATDNTISLNGTTKGGKVGDFIEIVDIAANKMSVRIIGGASGTVVTPFSHV